MAALQDDLNTPKAIAEMHALADRALQGDGAAAAGLRAAGDLLGLVQQDAAQWFQGGDAVALSSAEIDALIAERRSARDNRDFAAADRIRDELAAQGVLLEDGASGTTWRRAS